MLLFILGISTVIPNFGGPMGIVLPEGKEFEEIFSLLNLSQIISEPTNFTPGKKPSRIDLIVTDQPNLIYLNQQTLHLGKSHLVSTL